MHWYNPKTSEVEDVRAPSTDEEALEMLRGDISSEVFIARYETLREEGMGVEQAMIFVGHEFRLWHLRHLPIGQQPLRPPAASGTVIVGEGR